MTASPRWYPIAAAPVLLATVVIAYAANKFFTSQTMRESAVEPEEPATPGRDLEKMPAAASAASTSSWKKLGKRLRRRKLKISEPVAYPPETGYGPGFWALEPTSINDPSRLVRRSTDRSLAARSYVPPRSTVQFIPGAYDLSSAGPSYYSQPSQIPGSASFNFATGTSGDDGLYSQVSQMSASYTPRYQEYQPHLGVEGVDGTPFHLHELEDPSVNTRPQTPLRPNVNANTRFGASNAVVGVEHALSQAKARAIYDFDAVESEDLGFKIGDVITLIDEIDLYAGWMCVLLFPDMKCYTC
jgi:hypothetical protein